MELRSEFAWVRVEMDVSANGPRLMIEDRKTGRRAFFDPLELETFAWLDHADLSPLLDPSFSRWSEPAAGALERSLWQLGDAGEG